MAKRIEKTTWESQVDSRNTLHLYNSLTKSKVVFTPQDGNKVLWYSCGPTVYDATHMGHARCYITFDILRRVLSEYFHYDVTYVMNITDIDDKIIKRARQDYLFKEYLNANHSHEKILQDARDVFKNLLKLIQITSDIEKCAMYKKLSDKVDVTVKALEESLNEKNLQRLSESVIMLLNDIRDPFSDYLDSRLGNTVMDNSIFTKLPRYWEEEFHKDINTLNILPPNVLTRVSEYIPEIIKYVQQIITCGYAYESNGSVYFDVESFNSDPNHDYAKLVPEAYGDTKSLLEGEGALSLGDKSEKKSANDFALWKASKPGEPWWDSPWGNGRPGWHIECSVMASTILGSTLDIHTGGIDLKFPHHDNELAQAEAYYDKKQWVNYFLHSGHLTIAGCKMSKSLKNFITIKEALNKYSVRQLRFAFLLHSWKDTLDYSDNTMEMAISYEKLLNEFFLSVKDVLHNKQTSASVDLFEKLDNIDLELFSKFNNTKKNVHEYLCDNVDTKRVLHAFRDCISYCNVYIKIQSAPNYPLLSDIAIYITRMLQIFGVIPENIAIGFPLSSNKNDKLEVESVLMPILDILAEFRHNIRAEALTIKHVNILQICDALRDTKLPEFGVRLEDREGKPSAIKLVDKETLQREQEEKEKIKREKMLENEIRQKKLEEKSKNKDIPPENLFRLQTDKFSQFDDQGIPTHDVNGVEISKGQRKKFIKMQQKQKELYLASNNNEK